MEHADSVADSFLLGLEPEATGFVSRSSCLCHVSTLCIRMLSTEMETGVLLTHPSTRAFFALGRLQSTALDRRSIHCFLPHLPLKAGNGMLHVRIVQIHWVSDPS